MPRRGAWGSKKPHSLQEWIVGCNIEDLLPERAKKGQGIVTVTVSTDDESEADTVSITYPRARANSARILKKVRFETPTPTNLKSALKKPVAADSDSGADSSAESNADTNSSTDANSSGSEKAVLPTGSDSDSSKADSNGKRSI